MPGISPQEKSLEESFVLLASWRYAWHAQASGLSAEDQPPRPLVTESVEQAATFVRSSKASSLYGDAVLGWLDIPENRTVIFTQVEAFQREGDRIRAAKA